MAYTKTNWVAGVTPLSEANLDHLETQYDEIVADYDPPIAIRKTADQIINDSAVLTNDTHLLFPVLANEVWAFTIVVLSDTQAASDLRWSIVAPVGAVIKAMSIYYSDSVYYGFVNESTPDRVQDGITPVLIGVVTVGVNAGNLQFQWAQAIAVAENTIVREDSYIIAHQLV